MLGAIWHDMGFIRWPMGFSALAVMALTAFSAVKLMGSAADPSHRTKTWVDAILFWGGFSLVSGVLGTVVGIIIAAQSIEMAGEVHTTLVWGGVKVAMLSTAFGVLTLALSSLAWFALQLRWRLLRAQDLDGS